MLKKTISALATSILLLASHSASAVVIDLFTDDQAILSVTGTSASSSATGTDIIGGERDISVISGSKAKTEVEVAYGELNVASNLAGYDSSADAESTIEYTVVVQWDGVDGSMALDDAGLGGVDLSGLTGFLVQILSSDGFGSFTVQITESDGTTFEHSYAYIAVSASNPTSFVIEFTDFAGLDLSDIGSIQLTLNGVGNTDIRVASIETVPEPSSLAVMGLALVGLAGVARRQKRK